ncbi:type VI secretion system secreted protein VgrG [Pseudomonas sp. ok272]|uniref:type VI secretion system Vgr family protein n=1 Tax=unclassified Pseudomonas TaxID=196821 RepID=UPI0008CBDC5C|nr:MULTISPECIES: type VI secretion system tip protein TssI/VgrG [unclassified Pseudomonas]SEM68340.1 type VI secretion system secreted protein VgrG [Pseudomonas sp. ok272]SFM57131.1 type VI secretion system secreted protein VgrG [Pseudomonas sp. ok602]
MHNHQESPFTLTLTQPALSFAVRQFSGQEALNQLFRVDIEVCGPFPALNPEHWLRQPAFLNLGDHGGMHGIIHSASLCHDDTQQVGYRLTLVPHLLALERTVRRRIWRQLSVPQLLRRLLCEHRLPPDSYRFELPHGEYPPRELCVQYDESDLHLLQRLCEEEGIHYRFVHQHERHVLVFAEDSASFAQPALATFYHLAVPHAGQPVIRQLSLHHRQPLPGPRPRWQAQSRSQPCPSPVEHAANHASADPQPALGRPLPTQRYQDQLTRRELERLRCRQQVVCGASTEPQLRSGEIVQVCGHPIASLNDQWLVCEVQHHYLAPEGYHNAFSAIPWSTEFRPALEHDKPCISGQQLGHIVGPSPDAQGRIEITLWSQPDNPEAESVHLPVAHRTGDHLPLPLAGSEVLLSFLDGDPDRPVLCASSAPATPHDIATRPAHPSLSLSANGNLLTLSAASITLTGPMLAPVTAPGNRAPEHEETVDEQHPPPSPWSGKIHLFEQPPATHGRLGDTRWYIVRMPRPGLKDLGALSHKDVVMDGTSLASGELALTMAQKQQLAREYARTPEQLYLMYPKQCVALADYFQQHWSSEQRLAFIDSALCASHHHRTDDNHLLFDWLINHPGIPR